MVEETKVENLIPCDIDGSTKKKEKRKKKKEKRQQLRKVYFQWLSD